MEHFTEWMRRVQSGEPRAAAEFVREYEPTLRKVIRIRLVHLRLGRVLEDRDISQSVLGQFFANAAAGRFVIDSPDRLRALLATMARNKVQDEARKQLADRRRHARIPAGAPADHLDDLAGDHPTPSRIVGGRELVEEIQRRFSAEERALFRERSQGHDWATIASSRGVGPEAVRKKLARAVDRVFREMGISR